MKFRPAEPDENFKLLRMLSTGGRWEVGLCPVFFGVRVRAGIVGDCGPSIDLCAGNDSARIDLLLKLVVSFLRNFPESATGREVSSVLPLNTIKPVWNDPAFMDKFIPLCGEFSIEQGCKTNA
jgi:hypothetical protein